MFIRKLELVMVQMLQGGIRILEASNRSRILRLVDLYGSLLAYLLEYGKMAEITFHSFHSIPLSRVPFP